MRPIDADALHKAYMELRNFKQDPQSGDWISLRAVPLATVIRILNEAPTIEPKREPNTGSTTVRVGVPLKESVIVQKTELTDECIDRIADTVVQKLTEPSKIIEAYAKGWMDGAEAVCQGYERKTEPQTDGIIFKGNLKEGDYKLIKTTNGWVLEGNDIAYYGEPQTGRSE